MHLEDRKMFDIIRMNCMITLNLNLKFEVCCILRDLQQYSQPILKLMSWNCIHKARRMLAFVMITQLTLPIITLG